MPKKGWKCTCEMCKEAFNKRLDSREWLDFVRHREGCVVEFDNGDGIRIYVTCIGGDILIDTQFARKHKTIDETWGEEAAFTDHISGYKPYIHDTPPIRGTPFYEDLIENPPERLKALTY